MTPERGPTIKLVDAFTDGSTIFVNIRSEKYKRAAKGDAIALPPRSLTKLGM